MKDESSFVESYEFKLEVNVPNVGLQNYTVVADIYKNSNGCFSAMYKYLQRFNLIGKGGPVILNGIGKSKLREKIRRNLISKLETEEKNKKFIQT